MIAFSEGAESLRKSQLVASNTQLNILKQQEAIQRFTETHSSSGSSQKFDQCNKEIASGLEMIRESARVKEEHLQLQFENLKAKFTNVNEQHQHQLSELQKDHKARIAKIDERQEQSHLSQEQTMATMTSAQKKSEENLQAELNSLGQQMKSEVKLISEAVLMLASNMDQMTLESRSNQDKIERELDSLADQMKSNLKSFQSQTSSLQNSLSEQIRSLMKEIKSQISKGTESTDGQSQPESFQSPIRPKSVQ